MNLPEGFTASGVAAGLKPSGNPDVGLLVSDRSAVAAGIFTKNRVLAAPVEFTKRQLRRGVARGIVVNAGNANACTGTQGHRDARAMAKHAGTVIGVHQKDVLVASTGIIGVPMPMDLIEKGIVSAGAALSPDAHGFAHSILTTDTRSKVATARIGDALIVGYAKGSGMIAPEMATMLAFIATDAVVPRSVLAPALEAANTGSFNAISVDGCMSTNDSVIVMANGASGVEPSSEEFGVALAEVCGSLARQIVEDGEGATKIVTIRVQGATKISEARRAASSVANSVLLRCAMNGADPNWGRVLAALGTSGIPFDPRDVDVWLGGEQLCARGMLGPGDAAAARRRLQEREIEVRIDMHRGDASAVLLTNDLSAEYVRINAEYTT